MTDSVRAIVEKNIEQMFVDVVKEYDLKYGDIEPSQAFRLDDIKEELGEMLCDFVHGNTEVDDEEV